ncbi:MAG TPA: response regulator [Caulobacteraceae bacterium]
MLIVDDNEVNRRICGAFCEMAGYSCDYAQDGAEAVEAVTNAAFAVVLMDIHMPRMDGLTAARAIRALPGRRSAVPIIAVTTSADPEDEQRYRAAGLTDVVAKPLTPARLLEAIATALHEPSHAS